MSTEKFTALVRYLDQVMFFLESRGSDDEQNTVRLMREALEREFADYFTE